MEGILYVTDDKNQKKYVQIDLDKHGDLWRDFYDGLSAELTKGEETIPIGDIIKELEENENLNKYV